MENGGVDSETAPTMAKAVNQSHSTCREDEQSRAILRDTKDAGCSLHIPVPCSRGAPAKTRWIVAADGELPQAHLEVDHPQPLCQITAASGTRYVPTGL